MKGYDNLGVNHGIVLDLPFREATGLITHDIAKPHHIATLTGPPVWTDVLAAGIGPSDLGILQLNGVNQYLQIPGADTLDLDFIGDFTLAAWVYPIYTASAMVIMCRNTTGVQGWCMFLYDNPALGPLLSLRTNQGGPAPGYTECYAAGFPDSEPQLVGFSRDSAGLSATAYKNGKPVTTVLGPTGLIDPVACGAANKLLIGVQDGEAISHYRGYKWRPRAWPWKLSDADWLSYFERTKHWFGVT
ncbi:hypothetical protein ES703_00333 [subsurface metagenome]